MSNCWIFDFDGTLVDSEPAIKECYIKITKKFAPNKVNFAKNILIGPTLDETCSLILNDEYKHLKNDFIEEFIKEYDENILLNTKPYKFAKEILIHLYGKGDDLFIATNKRAKPTKKLISYYGWDNLFKWIGCMDEHNNFKNKSQLIEEKIRGNLYEKIFFTGDTVNDGIAARDNNIPFLFAKYGYGKKQNWTNIPIHKTIMCLEDLKKVS